MKSQPDLDAAGNVIRSEVAILRSLVRAQQRVIDALWAGDDAAPAERRAQRYRDEWDDRREYDRPLVSARRRVMYGEAKS
ncbi:MAG: hypothetical protein LC640_09025 [Frankia sp.]|nr:hypothetical protein [Frankia sp.]